MDSEEAVYTVPRICSFGHERRDIFINPISQCSRVFNLWTLTPFLFQVCTPVTRPGMERRNCKRLRYSSHSGLSGDAGTESVPSKGLGQE